MPVLAMSKFVGVLCFTLAVTILSDAEVRSLINAVANVVTAVGISYVAHRFHTEYKLTKLREHLREQEEEEQKHERKHKR